MRRLFAMTLLVIVVFLIDLISGGTIRALAQNAAASIGGVSVRVFNAVKYSGIFHTRATLAAQNQALEAQIARYEAQAAAYKALQEENAQLATQAHLAQDNTGITVPVVSSLRSSPYGTFLIGAGSAEHIKQNALVLTDLGFVVGRVTDVSAHTSLVTELFASGKTVSALVAGANATLGGAGGSNARAQIPRGIAVTAGDIVTSGSVGGRPIGIVGKVESRPADAYSTVYMRLPQNIYSLRFVFVLSSTP